MIDCGGRSQACVHGVPTACLGLCRAITELVLKKHYHCEGEDLEKIIAAAQTRPKHVWMKKLRLQNMRRLANTALHDYRTIEESAVVEFLAVVKQLIERAPSSSNN